MTAPYTKKRIALFGAQSRDSLPQAALSTTELLRMYGQDDFELYCYDEVVFEISSVCRVYVVTQGGPVDLRTFDTVFLRSPANEPVRAAIARYCDHFDVAVINSENVMLPLSSKLVQYVVAALHGVAVPDTFYCDSLELRSVYAPLFFGESNDSYVVKSIQGSNGRDNSKVEKLSVVPDAAACVIQRFIKNSFEYRVIVVDGEIAIAYKKVNVGKAYQNNIARGGTRELVEQLPNDVAAMAAKMANLAKREVAGIDVVYDENSRTHKLFEINFSYGHPGFAISSNEMQMYGSLLAKLLIKERMGI